MKRNKIKVVGKIWQGCEGRVQILEFIWKVEVIRSRVCIKDKEGYMFMKMRDDKEYFGMLYVK